VFGISRKQMIWLCHSMHTMLDAGLPMSRVLAVVSGQAPPGGLRRALLGAQAAVDGGATLTEAFQQAGAFPPLFIHLVAAGEASGTLDRTLAELARFFEFQQRVWRRFLGQIAMPVMQYIAAVAIVSFATWVIRLVNNQHGGLLPGLALGYGIPLALIALYVAAVRALGVTRMCHEFVLRVPVLGAVMRNLALARFSLIMYLMYEGAVPVPEALRRSFGGSGNAAFAARAGAAVEAIKDGGTMTDALLAAGLFPREYTEVIQVAEESGKLSERLNWLASEYAERAERALAALAAVAAKLIWAAVAAVIIFYIFKIFGQYVGAIQGAMR
jgi:type IV pilus assembly protein PilC